MPAALPGDTAANNTGANPAAGRAVIFDPLSGPKGSPLDFDNLRNTITGPAARASGNASTGALSTGIGFGLNGSAIGNVPSAPEAIFKAGYNDNQVPGTKPTYAAFTGANPGVVATNTVNSTRMYIGGGKVVANTNDPGKYSVPFVPSNTPGTPPDSYAPPYTAGVALAAAGSGNGGAGEGSRTGSSRDAGTGPAFTGFPMKMVTATGAVPAGSAVETGFLNRSGAALVAGQSVWGSDAAASAAPASVEPGGVHHEKKASDDPSQEQLEREFDQNLQLELEAKKDAPVEDDRSKPGKHKNGR